MGWVWGSDAGHEVSNLAKTLSLLAKREAKEQAKMLRFVTFFITKDVEFC